MLEQADLFNWNQKKPASKKMVPMEWKVVALRECPLPESLSTCDSPEGAVNYWHTHIKKHPYFNPDCECFAVLLLNTKLKIKGHVLVSIGTLDTILVHAREVFRAAVISASSRITLMHNHPSGDPTPSSADIATTRRLIDGGKILGIEVQDHIIIGASSCISLREMGYFH